MITDTKFSFALPVIVIVSLLLAPALSNEKQGKSIRTPESAVGGLTDETQAVGQIVVRLYNDWQSDPRSYRLISVPSSGLWVSFDAVREAFPGLKDSAAIVVSGKQQKDNTVATILGNSVCAERYQKGKRFFIFPARSDTKGSIWWTLADALGNLVPKVSVDIFVRGAQQEGPCVYLHTATTNEQGQFEVPELTGTLRFLSFAISDPNYGVCRIDRYLDDHLVMPLVPQATEAFERSIHGIVVNPEGKPIGGAVIECYNIRTLGEGLINALHGWTYKTLTDERGFFSLYLPNENPRDERGILIPPKSKYYVRIEAPKELGLLPYTEPIENGQSAAIVLERGGRFRTFAFEDANGLITDPRKLQYLSVIIYGPNDSRVFLRYNDFRNGGIFPPGEYHAVLQGIEDCEFEPLVVNEKSPEELIFSLPENILYRGRIVHGLMGEPMLGAFVIGYGGKSQGNLSMITGKQWEALHALPADPCLADPAVKPICEIYGVKKIVRTDELGRFQMSLRPGEIYGFIAFEENYLGLKHRRHALVPDKNRQAEVPVMKLYPSATVLVEAHAGAERISIWPRWIIDQDENPFWMREFLATDDRKESLFVYDDWIEQNKVQSFHVPAGLNLRVKLDTPYDNQWCPIEIPTLIHLAQGQVLDLGRHEFKPALEVSVRVVNSQARAIEGIPVRVLCGGNAWSVPHNSDESGLARFYVAPNSSGQFGVLYHEDGGVHLNETIPYTIGGDEDSGRQFTLQLSDEILNFLFGLRGLEPAIP
jgi:hypothetical protein